MLSSVGENQRLSDNKYAGAGDDLDAQAIPQKRMGRIGESPEVGAQIQVDGYPASLGVA
jgi:hypothetical protein